MPTSPHASDAAMASMSPPELFDVVNEAGQPTGLSKPRADVHRDGDWHQSVHLWVVFETVPRTVLLQRRSRTKDTNPGLVDVSVAGHLSAGESPTDALRESEEEVGLPVLPAQCVSLGTRRSVYLSDRWNDREIQHIFAVFTDVPFESLRPHPTEVASLLRVTLDDLRALHSRGAPCPATEREGDQTRDLTLTLSDLVATGDGYPAWALEAISGGSSTRRPTVSTFA